MALIDVLWGAAMVGTMSYTVAVRASGRIVGRHGTAVLWTDAIRNTS
jgi:hypothetical protein